MHKTRFEPTVTLKVRKLGAALSDQSLEMRQSEDSPRHAVCRTHFLAKPGWIVQGDASIFEAAKT
jgi:hypothetical protein